ncbi:MAG: RidA family protein [Pseudorhodoplanes sp.]
MKSHIVPTLPRPSGYSHATEVAGPGRIIYTSGMLGVDSAGNVIGKGDIRAQTEKTFENLKAALAAAGAGFEHVVKMNTYVVDVKHVPIIREVRARYLNASTPPASTLVGVAALASPDLLIEVEVIAVLPER